MDVAAAFVCLLHTACLRAANVALAFLASLLNVTSLSTYTDMVPAFFTLGQQITASDGGREDLFLVPFALR